MVNHVETRDDIDACNLKQRLLQIGKSRNYRVLDAVLVSSHRRFMTNEIQQVGFFPFLVNRPATSDTVPSAHTCVRYMFFKFMDSARRVSLLVSAHLEPGRDLSSLQTKAMQLHERGR